MRKKVIRKAPMSYLREIDRLRHFAELACEETKKKHRKELCRRFEKTFG